ncbi:MAG: hypothetical protein ACRD01_05565 [Terriglobales bacterium]
MRLLSSSAVLLFTILAMAQAPARRPGAAPGGLTLPAQTPIRLQLETHLSTRDNKYGDGFAARVMTAVFFQGREIIPEGSILEGHVMRVRDERPVRADSELMLKPDLLTLPNGQRYVISAEVVQSDPQDEAKVDQEGMLHEPRGLMTTDLHHTEAGAAGGAVGGALLAGGSGAALGAGVGAVVGVGIWLVRHRHLELNPGSILTVKLDRPLALRASVLSNQ